MERLVVLTVLLPVLCLGLAGCTWSTNDNNTTTLPGPITAGKIGDQLCIPRYDLSQPINGTTALDSLGPSGNRSFAVNESALLLVVRLLEGNGSGQEPMRVRVAGPEGVVFESFVNRAMTNPYRSVEEPRPGTYYAEWQGPPEPFDVGFVVEVWTCNGELVRLAASDNSAAGRLV